MSAPAWEIESRSRGSNPSRIHQQISQRILTKVTEWSPVTMYRFAGRPATSGSQRADSFLGWWPGLGLDAAELDVLPPLFGRRVAGLAVQGQDSGDGVLAVDPDAGEPVRGPCPQVRIRRRCVGGRAEVEAVVVRPGGLGSVQHRSDLVPGDLPVGDQRGGARP